MVRVMPRPQKAVHNVFVGKPCDPFHKKERADDNRNLPKYVHTNDYFA